MVRSHRHTLAAAIALAAAVTTSAGCSDSGGTTDTGSGGTGFSAGGAAGASSGGTGGTSTNECDDCAGCCQAGRCVPPAGQSEAVCGLPGGVCAACDFGYACSDSGCEVDPGVCSPATCAGCCASGVSCVQPSQQDAIFCGAGGDFCGSCAGGVLCQAGMCTDQLDPAAVFFIRINEVESTERDSGGAAWDTLGGLPDLQVCAVLGNGQAGCTGFCDDSTTCTYTETGDITGADGNPISITGADLAAGLLELRVWDDDLTTDDLVGSASFAIEERSTTGYASGPFDQVVNLVFELY